ncbi:hypothetical protein V8G54_009160, partial [Vigna mungo]
RLVGLLQHKRSILQPTMMQQTTKEGSEPQKKGKDEPTEEELVEVEDTKMKEAPIGIGGGDAFSMKQTYLRLEFIARLSRLGTMPTKANHNLRSEKTSPICKKILRSALSGHGTVGLRLLRWWT